MPPSLLNMTTEIVKAQIEAGHVTPDATQETLQDVFATLSRLHAREEARAQGDGSPWPEVLDWRKSITRHAITCLECGAVYKQLSIRHLREHDLNARSYRAKHGIPQAQPLAARDTTIRRRQAVEEIRPWEKSPRYLQAQARGAAGAKKTAAAKRRRRRS